MPRSRGFRLIQGGKRSGAAPPGMSSTAQLLEQAAHYRVLLGRKQRSDAYALVDDMEEAIAALGRHEQKAGPEALMRVQEYRRLVAEIGSEIDAILKGF